MAIYKMVGDKERLVEVESTSFGQQGVLERSDLQRILRDQPSVLEDGLLIIAEEFGNWQDSNRRIDLLGLDAEGRLVVVELKRGETGGHMDLQAIRYAAMVANMTYQQTVDTCQSYLEKRANEEGGSVDENAAENVIRDHLGNPEEEADAIRTEIPRIILASENFGKELTTCVMWLNDSWLRDAGQEITCVRLQPHKNGDEVLVESSVIIPLPEASDYQTRLGQRAQEVRTESSRKAQNIPGAEAFQESIESAPEQHRPRLRQLYDATIEMQQEEIVEVVTNISGKADCYSIRLRAPDQSRPLVWFNNNLPGRSPVGAQIGFQTGWEEIAPNSLARLNDLIGPDTSKDGVRWKMLSAMDDVEAVLTVICNAFREASGHQIEAASPQD